MSEQILNIIMNAKEQPVQTKVNRVAHCHRMKVIEVINENKEYFYLVFYKDQFITGMKTPLKKKSHLGKFFKKGITFTPPHPLIDTFLNSDQIYHLKPIDQLLKPLSKKYTPQETSLILSYFDSFFLTEKTADTIKEFFYNYRRDGQLRLAFQILTIMLSIDPKNKWALDMCNHIDFLKFRESYAINNPDLLKQDQLYFEILYFNNKHQKQSFDSLQIILSEQSKWRDQIALYLDQLSNPKIITKQHYDSFINLISEHFSVQDRVAILLNSYKTFVLDERMIQQLVNELFNLGMNEDAINVIIDKKQFSTIYKERISSLFETNTIQIHKINLDHLRSYLLDEPSPQHVETMLYSIIPRLLEDYDIAYVHEWIKPLLQLELQIPILENIQMMFSIKDDPEEQFDLGKLYHKFKQNQKAIDCFNWEMELNPSDPIPVQWLAKLYRELGMIEESNNYMYVYTSLQKATS